MDPSNCDSLIVKETLHAGTKYIPLTKGTRVNYEYTFVESIVIYSLPSR